MAVYSPATSEIEARRWHALGKADIDTRRKFVVDNRQLISAVRGVLSGPLDPAAREQLERMLRRAERENEYLEAVNRGVISPFAKIERAFT